MAPRPGTKKYSDATREKALALAAERTAAHASRELGIPVSTIYKWRQDKGVIGPPTNERDPEAWAAKKEQGARESWAEAKSALALVKERLEAGEENRAKTAALTFAILADKSAMLEQASALAEERNPKISEAQGQLIAEVIGRTLEDLGIQPEAAASVLGHYLRQAQDGGSLEGPAPEAEAARRAVGAAAMAEWEQGLPSGERLEEPGPELPSTGDRGQREQPPPVEGKAREKSPEEKRRDDWNRSAGPSVIGYGAGRRRGTDAQ